MFQHLLDNHEFLKLIFMLLEENLRGRGKKLKFIGHLKLKFDLWLIVDWQTLDTMLVL